ncbi:hypothetical protein M0L70_RS11060 [Providencia rettgeri]|nr:hypothetical protein [Providencia rettgeri]
MRSAHQVTEFIYAPSPIFACRLPATRIWVYFATARAFRTAIRDLFSLTLPAIAGELIHRINDNFQILKPASSS